MLKKYRLEYRDKTNLTGWKIFKTVYGCNYFDALQDGILFFKNFLFRNYNYVVINRTRNKLTVYDSEINKYEIYIFRAKEVKE